VARLAHADADEVEGDLALLGVAIAEANGHDLIDAGHWRAGTTTGPADRHCAAMVRDEGGDVLALPASDGTPP